MGFAALNRGRMWEASRSWVGRQPEQVGRIWTTIRKAFPPGCEPLESSGSVVLRAVACSMSQGLLVICLLHAAWNSEVLARRPLRLATEAVCYCWCSPEKPAEASPVGFLHRKSTWFGRAKTSSTCHALAALARVSSAGTWEPPCKAGKTP